MNAEPDSASPRGRKFSRSLRLWSALTAALFLVLLISVQFLPGGPRTPRDWLCAVSFLLGVSLGAATLSLGGWWFVRWLCHWRNLKRFAFVCACPLILIALFYAAENWRGWQAWRRFEIQWEAKGEHLSLARLVPPPVPDDQNFALTPIVLTSYGWVLTREGKPIPDGQRDPQFAVRMRMLSSSSTGPGPTNRPSDWVRGEFINLKNWQTYYRERAAETNEFPVPAQPGSPAADVVLALSRYDAVIEELRAASRLPHSRFPLNYDSESAFSIMLPHLAVLKGCAQTLSLRSVAELQNSQSDQALADTRLALQLTERVRTEPLVISHLVRLAMLQVALQPVWEGLANHNWSDAQLQALDGELMKLDFVADYGLVMRGDLAAQCRELDYLRSQPERLSELRELRDLQGHSLGLNLPTGLLARFIPTGWFYQNQSRCARMMQNYWFPAADIVQGTFSPDVARQGEATLIAETNTAGPYRVYARFLLPFFGDAPMKFGAGQTSANLARTAIALERCRLARGEFPETLDTLAPQFIAQVPRDVIGGQSLKYRREANDQFVVYSVGWNEKDDGGTVALKPDGSLDTTGGDWVWRYPSKTAK